MDQPALNIAYTLQAQGKNNGVTTNYSAALGYPVGTVSLVAENANAGVDLAARISGLPAVSWSGGQYVVNSPTSRFSRAAAPDGAYDALAIGVKVVDADGAVLSSRDMNAATTGACGAGCDARQLGGAATTTRVRYGRLWLQNSNGSELLALPVPMETQYYSNSGFTTNTLDNCTSVAASNVGLGNYQGGLTAGETTASVAAGAFAAGKKTLTLSRPGAGNSGAADIVVNLCATTTIDNTTTCLSWSAPVPTPAAANLPWLLGQWCGASANRSPTARATFGTFRNTNKFIFQRENF
jgi:MSHA biogenesis protein MshQ